MAAMFLAMVWHARRRVDALQIAEGRAEERRSLLERQERFIHDASHELRTPLTIARGHLELLRLDGHERAELDMALDELGRIDAIIERLLVLAAADQPDFVLRTDIELESFLEDVFVRWADVAPRAWRLARWRPGACASTPTGCAPRSTRCSRTPSSSRDERDAIELRVATRGAGSVLIEVEDEGAGFLMRRSTGSSTGSRAPMRRVPASTAASAWGWRSSTRSPRATVGAAPWSAPAAARSSRCSFRRSAQETAVPMPRLSRSGANRRPPARQACRRRAGRHTGAPRRTASGVVTTPARTPDWKSRAHAVGDGLAAPVGLEPLEVEPELRGALPQVRILEPPLVGEQQVVHLPEAVLERRRLGRACRRPGPRVTRAHREVTEHPPEPHARRAAGAARRSTGTRSRRTRSPAARRAARVTWSSGDGAGTGAEPRSVKPRRRRRDRRRSGWRRGARVGDLRPRSST